MGDPEREQDPKSERTLVLEAILDDPLNVVLVMKTLHDRGLLSGQRLCVLVKHDNGGVEVESYVALRKLLLGESGAEVSIYELGPGWYVQDNEEDVETGPMKEREDALSWARLTLKGRGLDWVDNVPLSVWGR